MRHADGRHDVDVAAGQRHDSEREHLVVNRERITVASNDAAAAASLPFDRAASVETHKRASAAGSAAIQNEHSILSAVTDCEVAVADGERAGRRDGASDHEANRGETHHLYVANRKPHKAGLIVPYANISTGGSHVYIGSIGRAITGGIVLQDELRLGGVANNRHASLVNL